MRYLIFLQLALLVLIASCGGGAGGVGSFLAKGDAPAVTSVDFANDQLIINGSNLAGVTSVSVEGEDFDVESISETQLVVNAQQALAFIAGATYNLLVSNAFGAASYSITFTPDNNSITTNMIVDNAITTNKIADEAITESKLSDMGASDGDFLQWDQATSSWIPTTLNGLTYLGTWDATSAAPADPNAGEYYVVSVAGDTDLGSQTAAWSVGDWAIYNGTDWQKIDNSNAVTNVFGRQGAITGVEGDYNIDLLGDVDTTTATPADGQVLTWDQAGGNWVPATESDPKVGTLTNGKWCTTDGNVINCESAPGAETDPIFGAHVASSITDSGSGVVISVAERNGITNNASSISTNATNIATNDSDIATNVTNISTNATNISSNDTDIATNATNISTNGTDIATNVTNISTNATNISSNDTDIATNVTNISTNATNISSNDTDIAANATAISGKVDATGTNGQTIIGGTANDSNLTLISSSGTPGFIQLNPSGGKVMVGAAATGTPAGTNFQVEGRMLVHGSSNSGLAIQSDSAHYVWQSYHDLGGADEKKWDIRAYSNILKYRALSDDYLSNESWLEVYRTGYAIDKILFPNGNVGIGSSSPASALDVAGTIRAQQLCDESGANCNDLSSGAIAVSGDVSASGGNVSVGTTDATYNITFDGDTNQTIGVLEQTTGAGSSLTINSGAAQSGSTDSAGGNLILSSGSATGSGGSAIEFKTATSGASGTVTATPSTKMVITEAGQVGIGTTAPNGDLHIWDGDSATNIKIESGIDYLASVNFLSGGSGTQKSVIGYFHEDDAFKVSHAEAGTTLNDDHLVVKEGNVGVGTVNPTSRFYLQSASGDNIDAMTVNAGGDGAGEDGLVVLARHSTNFAGDVFRAEANKASSTDFNLITTVIDADGTPTYPFKVRGNGNVGIGVPNAQGKLSILGSSTNRVVLAGSLTDVNQDTPKLSFFGMDSASVVGPSIQGISTGPWARHRLAFLQHDADDYSTETEVMSILPDGKVGIGTTAPLYALDVQSGVNSGSPIIGRFSTTDTNPQGLYVQSISNTGTLIQASEFGVVNNDLYLNYHGGNVGIGTTNPGQKLHVVGDIATSTDFILGYGDAAFARRAEIKYDPRGGSYMPAGATFDNGTSGSRGFSIWTNGVGTGTGSITGTPLEYDGVNMLFLQDGYGRVGIGTTGPAAELDVAGQIMSKRASHQFALYDTDTSATEWTITTYSDQGLSFFENGSTSRLTMLAGGNVGIGTTNPTGKLTVEEDQANSELHVSTYGDSTKTSVFRLKRARNTQAAPSPVQGEDEVGSMVWQGYDGTGHRNVGHISVRIDGTPGANDMPGRMMFGTTADGDSGTTERMRIDSNGNVGIGTTDPQTTLHVAGSIRSNDHYRKNIAWSAGWAIGDYKEIVRASTQASGSSSHWEVVVSATRGNHTESALYRFATLHGSSDIWREVPHLGENGYSSTEKTKCFTLDANGHSGSYHSHPRFRVRAVKTDTGCGGSVGTQMNLYIIVRSLGWNTSWTELSATGNDTSINTFQTMGGSWNLYTGMNSTEAGNLAIHVDKDANVGIGTNAPSEKLEVAGTIKATDVTVTSTWYNLLTPTGWTNQSAKCRHFNGWIEFRGRMDKSVVAGWPSETPVMLPVECRPQTTRHTETPCHASASPRNSVCNIDYYADGSVYIYTDFDITQIRFEGVRIWGDAD